MLNSVFVSLCEWIDVHKARCSICALSALGTFVLLCGGCARSVEPAKPTTVEQRFDAEPDDAAANFELGRRSEAVSDFVRADQYYRRAEALAKDDKLLRQVRHRIVATLVEARRFDEARERCLSILDETPGDRPARFLLAAILASLDHSKEAERELVSLRDTLPDDPQVYLALGKLYRDSFGDRARATTNFERFLVLAPRDHAADSIRFQLERDRLEAGTPEPEKIPLEKKGNP